MTVRKNVGVWMLVVCMLFAYVPVISAEEQDTNIAGILDQADNITRTLLDFNDEAVVTGGTASQGELFTVSTGEDGVYEDPNVGSARWTQTGTAGLIRYDLYPAGQSVLDSSWFNLRLYSPAASGAVYQFIVFGGENPAPQESTTAVTNITCDWVGWKTVNVLLTYNVGKTFHGAAFAYGAWAEGQEQPVTEGAELYLSKIWMSKALPDKEIFRFDSDESLNAYRAIGGATKFTKSSWYKEDSNTMSARWEQKKNGEVVEYCFDTVQDWKCSTNGNNAYQYVNLRLYSPTASGAVFQFMAVMNGPLFNSGYGSCYYGITADWVGWKTVSIPMNDFTASKGNWRAVSGMAFIVGWNNQPGFQQGAALYLDSIWLSVTEANANLKDAAPLPDKAVLQFDSEQAVTDGFRKLAGNGFRPSSGANGIYEAPNTVSARWTQDVAGAHCEKVLTDAAENWSDYGYLNIRAFASEASGAVFQIGLFEGSSYYTWSGGTGNNAFLNLTADWTGWKTVSLPLANLSGKLSLMQVNGIAFTNGSWGTAETKPPYVGGATLYLDSIWLSETAAEENAVPLVQTSVSLTDRLFIQQPEQSADGNSISVRTYLKVNGDQTADREKIAYWVAQYDDTGIRLNQVELFVMDLAEGVENKMTLDISAFDLAEGDTLLFSAFTMEDLKPLIVPEIVS